MFRGQRQRDVLRHPVRGGPVPQARAGRPWNAWKHPQPRLDRRAARPPDAVGLQRLQRCQANLTRCAAIEYGHEGIRVNGICPTYAKTALTRDLYEDMAFMREFAESVPLKRWGEVEDVASLALYLASDESSYIHGDLIRVDGGETLCRYSV